MTTETTLETPADVVAALKEVADGRCHCADVLARLDVVLKSPAFLEAIGIPTEGAA